MTLDPFDLDWQSFCLEQGDLPGLVVADDILIAQSRGRHSPLLPCRDQLFTASIEESLNSATSEHYPILTVCDPSSPESVETVATTALGVKVHNTSGATAQDFITHSTPGATAQGFIAHSTPGDTAQGFIAHSTPGAETERGRDETGVDPSLHISTTHTRQAAVDTGHTGKPGSPQAARQTQAGLPVVASAGGLSGSCPNSMENFTYGSVPHSNEAMGNPFEPGCGGRIGAGDKTPPNSPFCETPHNIFWTPRLTFHPYRHGDVRVEFPDLWPSYRELREHLQNSGIQNTVLRGDSVLDLCVLACTCGPAHLLQCLIELQLIREYTT
ncbi:hypothetical protein ElyMa_002088500 [Elysia marginata]|uniref:Uncharacterized protein n=1 Tax=Elysia marginata TaxID=1093978 RepID=A0AAV4FD13_9GAST|nr:hypothetical protein ElyMa_002088500 [Elysia marginata]